MGLHLITPPTEAVVEADDARAQLRLATSVTDAMIQALIGAATQQLDPAGNGWLGRALRPQTWELRLSGFPFGCGARWHRRHSEPTEWRADRIELPYPPLIAVDSVKYDDGDGVEQTLVAGTDYRVLGGGLKKSYLVPAYNGSWPSQVRCDDEAVRIRYACGYENGTAGDDMPNTIKQAIVLMAGHLNRLGERSLFLSGEDVPGVGSRTYVVSENAAKVMQGAAESLLSSMRVYD